MTKKRIVFDLDDTLVNEIDFLKSAFRAIAKNLDSNHEILYNKMILWYENKENVFLNLEKNYSKTNILDLKNHYRNHFPEFYQIAEIKSFLLNIKNQGHSLGLITDGFSVTQRNKIRALDIENLFDLIVISEEFGSEKPNHKNFLFFQNTDFQEYWYVGDNITKDFIAPNALGWTTVCLLDNGKNIHKQDFNKELIYLPKNKIKKLTDLEDLLKTN